MQLLTFLLNGICFGIPVSDVESIETRMNVFGVPEAPSNIKGVIKLHGAIVPIYSLSSRFHYPAGNVQNVIVAGVDGMKVGLEVESVREIVEIPDREIENMPEIMNATQNCFHNIASKGKELITILDVKHLISTEEQQSLRKLIDDQK